MRQRLISLFMAIVMIFSTLTNTALAVEGSSQGKSAEVEASKEFPLLDDFLQSLPKIKGEKSREKIRVIIEFDDKGGKEARKKVLAIEGVELKYNYEEIMDGCSIDIGLEELEELFAIKGIKNIEYSDQPIPQMFNAKELTRVVEAVQHSSDNKDLDGRGMVIATIDSGVDIKSKDLRLDDDPAVKAAMKIQPVDDRFTDKVPYAFSYFRGDEDVIDHVPRPHGMHIAGILAGNSPDPDGFKGIAPNAQLLVYKTITYDFKKGTDQENAIEYIGEDASYHAMDDAVKRGADVISLSIGLKGTGKEDDIWHNVVKNAYDKGVLVVAAMGNWSTSNSANTYDKYALADFDLIDNSATVSVAASPYAIGAGSTYNTKVSLSTLVIDGLGELAYHDLSKFNGEKLPQESFSSEFYYVGDGMGQWLEPDQDFSPIKNKVVLAKRGGEAVKEKAQRFLKAGAKGFILINESTDFSRGNYDVLPALGFDHLTIKEGWAITVSGRDGKKLIDHFNNNQHGPVEMKFYPQSKLTSVRAKTGMSGYSSYGPNYDLEIKPDLIAPGEDIYSLGNHNEYTMMSGTSMASPHIAGIGTLILQKNKDLTDGFYQSLGLNKVDFTKILMMNTAQVMMDLEQEQEDGVLFEYSPRRQGAGQVDLAAALSSDVLITYKNKGAASLKEIGPKTRFELEVKNFGKKKRKFIIESSPVLGEVAVERSGGEGSFAYQTKSLHDRAIAGASLSHDHELVIPAGKSVSLEFTLDSGQAKDQFVEGFIYFKSLTEDQADLSLPYMGFRGNWNQEPIIDPPAWEEGSKTSLVSLYQILKEAHHDDELEYRELGKSSANQVQANPDQFALTNEYVSYTAYPRPDTSTWVRNVAPRLVFLRDVQSYEVSIVDEKDDNKPALRILNTAHYPEKYIANIANYSEKSGPLPDTLLKWDGKIYDSSEGEFVLAEEGQYYYRIKTALSKKGQAQVLYLPIKVDNTSPELTLSYDKSKKQVLIDAQDNFGIFTVQASLDGKKLEVKGGENGKYFVDNLEPSSLTEGKLQVETMDYAGRASKKEMKLNDDLAEISNLEDLMDKKTNQVEILVKDQVAGVSLYRSGEKVPVKLEGQNLSFDLVDRKNLDYTIEYFDQAHGLIRRETLFLNMLEEDLPASHSEVEKDNDDWDDDWDDWDDGAASNDKFTDGDLYILNGGIRNISQIFDFSDEDMSVEEDAQGNIVKIFYYPHIWLKEGQKAVITNINPYYNSLHQREAHQPLSQVTLYGSDMKDDWLTPKMEVSDGNNIFNVKVYNISNDEEILIFNRGFTNYFDKEKPLLRLDNDNICYDDQVSDHLNGETSGEIYVKDQKALIKGKVSDNLDGWTLKINEDLVDVVRSYGEFGLNERSFEHTTKAKDGENIKIEVKDISENSFNFNLRVVEDDVAPQLTIEPSDPASITSETILKISTSDNEEPWGYFDDSKLQPEVLVNGKHYQPGDQLKNYEIASKPGAYYIKARVRDLAGNETVKEIKVGMDDQTIKQPSLKKDSFKLSELNDINNILTLEEKLQAQIVNIIYSDQEPDLAQVIIELTNPFGIKETFTYNLKVDKGKYSKNSELHFNLKKERFAKGEVKEIEDLIDIPEDVSYSISKRLDLSEAGEKELVLRFYRDNSYNEVRYKFYLEEETFTLSYQTDGGTSYDKEIVRKGQIIDGEKLPEKIGYKFVGWYYDPGFNNKVSFPLSVLSDLVLYAKWEKVSSVDPGEGETTKPESPDSDKKEPISPDKPQEEEPQPEPNKPSLPNKPNKPIVEQREEGKEEVEKPSKVEKVERVAGVNRVSTAVEISKKTFDQADKVILAGSFASADALAAGGLAGKIQAPVLLTETGSLNQEAVKELQRLGVKEVTLTGGPASISLEVEQELKDLGFQVKRIAGKDRFETSLLVAQEIIKKNPSYEVFIANGLSQADALTISPVAAMKESPVLLTNGQSLTPGMEKIIQGAKQVTVIGGENSVNTDLMPNARRISGANRYETALAIAKEYFDSQEAILASGQVFVDALTASPYAAKEHAPILLSNKTGVDQKTNDFIQDKVKKLVLMGGKNAIADYK